MSEKLRDSIFYDIPEVWRENAKKGLCPPCGKHRSEFEKFMRVYCSAKCRDEYTSRIFTWGAFRDKILKERGEKCEQCGIDAQGEIAKRKLAADAELAQWVSDNKAAIELKRIELLRRVEEAYAQAMNDDYVIKEAAPYEVRKGTIWLESPKFEIDHKIALVNGGSQWDESNLQVLCTDCHHKKTADDMKVHRNSKKREKHGSLKLDTG